MQAENGAMATKEEQSITEQQPEATAEQKAAAVGAAAAQGASPSDMVAWFESAITNYEAMFIVFYRGYW